MRNKHSSLETMDQMTSSTTMAFKHPFSMVVSGPSGSRKSVWTKKLLLSSLIQPSPERMEAEQEAEEEEEGGRRRREGQRG